jgi:maltose O-acetyltransferase
MPGSVGEEVWIARTFNCDNGKKHIHWQSFFGSYNLTVLDAREIFIGDHVMIGPNHSKSKTTTSRKC